MSENHTKIKIQELEEEIKYHETRIITATDEIEQLKKTIVIVNETEQTETE